MNDSWFDAIKTQVFLAIATVFILLVIGEFGIRTYHYIRDGRPFLDTAASEETPIIERDSVLGWTVAAHRSLQHETHDLNGDKRTVKYTTGPHGFRMFGDAFSQNGKLLIVGDSFTHAEGVSDDQTYYSKLQSALSNNFSDIFVYGAGGYGTLQQALIIEKYINQVRPNAIIIQTCWNDFINNSYELESNSTENNNRALRPYLGLDGAIKIQLPQSTFRQTYLTFAAYSRFLTWVMFRFDNWVAVNQVTSTVEAEIRLQPNSHPGFARAVTLTDRLLERIRSSVPPTTTIYAFQVDDHEPFAGEFRKLFARHGIVQIVGVAEAITDAARKGESVYTADGSHWAPGGHSIAANIIAEQLRSQLLLSGARRSN